MCETMLYILTQSIIVLCHWRTMPLVKTFRNGYGALAEWSFSPQCPQTNSDMRTLFLLPKEYPEERFEQDEFRCLNLTVTTPAAESKRKLPVMIWIHGTRMSFIAKTGMLTSSTQAALRSIALAAQQADARVREFSFALDPYDS